MFRAIIVIWLVLLVLALSVVAFVTRVIEKYRPIAYQNLKKNHLYHTDQSTGDF